MKENIFEVIAVILTIVFVIFIGYLLKPYEQEIKIEQEECEHEWVITSEYSLLSKTGYRTVSKCIKCGKVIK